MRVSLQYHHLRCHNHDQDRYVYDLYCICSLTAPSPPPTRRQFPRRLTAIAVTCGQGKAFRLTEQSKSSYLDGIFHHQQLHCQIINLKEASNV